MAALAEKRAPAADYVRLQGHRQLEISPEEIRD